LLDGGSLTEIIQAREVKTVTFLKWNETIDPARRKHEEVRLLSEQAWVDGHIEEPGGQFQLVYLIKLCLQHLVEKYVQG